MKIKEMISQFRRDFRAIYECESCGNMEEGTGYDDDHFHQKVIPEMVCKKCGEKSKENYRALSTKYPAGAIV